MEMESTPPRRLVYAQGCPDTTSDTAQRETEELLADHYNAVLAPQLFRKNHAAYCRTKLRDLPEWTQGLHCSRPWLIYWTLHAADLLGALPELYATVAGPREIRHALQLCFSYDRAAEDLLFAHGSSPAANNSSLSAVVRRRCAGFGGGSAQMPHLAASYAAIMSLLILEETVGAVRATEATATRGGGSAEENSPSATNANASEPPFNYRFVDPTAAKKNRWDCLADVPWDCVSNWFESLALSACPPTSSPQTEAEEEDAEEKKVNANDGGFAMHIGGECDVRASYIVATVAATIGRLGLANAFSRAQTAPYITHRSWAFVLRCQRYEGGFSCGPLSPEVHGGYGQCALSALVYWLPLLAAEGCAVMETNAASSTPTAVRRLNSFSSSSTDSSNKNSDTNFICMPDMPRLRRWLTQRQMAHEGGFQGRTNKLVDSCYSHWIGTTFVLAEVLASLSVALFSSSSSVQLLLPQLLKGVGALDVAAAPNDSSLPDSSSSSLRAPRALSVADVLHIGSAALIDLSSEEGSAAALAALSGLIGDADDVDNDSLPALLSAQMEATEGAKVSAVEAFLADAEALQGDEAYAPWRPSVTKKAQIEKEEPNVPSDDEDGDSQYDDVNSDDDGYHSPLNNKSASDDQPLLPIEAAVRRYTSDGAGSLLCNQRALQQYVLKYCQELNCPSAAAPQPSMATVSCTSAADGAGAEEGDDAEAKEAALMRCALLSAMAAASSPTASGAGGLMDKPDHPNDGYHTCYAMSGVASMQQGGLLALLKNTLARRIAASSEAEGAGGDGDGANNSSNSRRLLGLLCGLQARGLLPPSSAAADVVEGDVVAAMASSFPSTFAPLPPNGGAAAAAAEKSGAVFPAVAHFSGGYDAVVVGRVGEDAYYRDALSDGFTSLPPLPGAAVQVVCNRSPATASGGGGAVHVKAENPNRTNDSQILSPANPMANIAARHFVRV